tara:strand:+ start:82 stop:813 length:732 start_codon:yes stop_codon:yes gene_type:complete
MSKIKNIAEIKTVVLCGGLGTRIFEETKTKPKPMIKIGDRPILSHILDTYQKYGFKNFLLAVGYKGKIIKNYFKKKRSKKIFVRVVDTGKKTMTGGRLLKLKDFFKKNENFMLTYGDGLSNQDLKNLYNYHLSHGKIATITAVRPPARYGELAIKGLKVKKFEEKPVATQSWINGGFFVFNAKIFKFIKNDKTILEKSPLESLSKKGQLMAFKHNGFWQCMDTMRDKKYLTNILKNNNAPWKN